MFPIEWQPVRTRRKSPHSRMMVVVAVLLGVSVSLTVMACSREENEHQPLIRADDPDGFASDEGVGKTGQNTQAERDQRPANDEILRSIRAQVPQVKPIPANVDIEQLLVGHYSDTTHVGPGLSGSDLYLFADSSYFYMEWADIWPLTIQAKGTWDYRDGFLVLLSDGSLPKSSGPRDQKYLPFILVATRFPSYLKEVLKMEPEELLLLHGVDSDFRYFLEEMEGDDESMQRLCTPECMLRLCTYCKAEAITSEESDELKNELFQQCWRPETLQE